jgi:hydrogenase maturation protein HypF
MLAEGQALAKESYPFHILDHRPMVVGTQGIIKGIVADVLAGEPADTISNKFHTTVADIILETCRRIRHETGVRQVALSGGVFQNARLLTESFERLSADGFVVFTHRAVPPNDGGLALGQIAIATAVLSQG